MTGIRPTCVETVPDTLAAVSFALPIVSVVQTRFATVAEEAVRTDPEKPLVELTGPEKVVELIENYLYARVARPSAHRPLGRSDGLVMPRISPTLTLDISFQICNGFLQQIPVVLEHADALVAGNAK